MSLGTRGACALYYRYQVKDAKGTIRVPFRLHTSKSFLKAYITFLFLRLIGPTTQSLTDTAGSSQTVHRNTELNAQRAALSSASGLVVGTGTNAVTISDSKLQTLIVHGTTAGTLSYGASVVNAPSSTSTTTTLLLTRVFSNSSGGSITVQELGIYALMGNAETATNNVTLCVVRDLQTIALSNGDQLTLNYILQTTA